MDERMEKTDKIKDSFLLKRREGVVPSQKTTTPPASYQIAQDLGIERPPQLGTFGLTVPKRELDNYKYYNHTNEMDWKLNQIPVARTRVEQGSGHVDIKRKVHFPKNYNYMDYVYKGQIESDVSRFRKTPIPKKRKSLGSLIVPKGYCMNCGKKYRGKGNHRKYCKACAPILARYRKDLAKDRVIKLKSRVGTVSFKGWEFIKHLKYQPISTKRNIKYTQSVNRGWISDNGFFPDQSRNTKGEKQIQEYSWCNDCMDTKYQCCHEKSGGMKRFKRSITALKGYDDLMKINYRKLEDGSIIEVGIIKFVSKWDIVEHPGGKIGTWEVCCKRCGLIPGVDKVKGRFKEDVNDDYLYMDRVNLPPYYSKEEN